MPNEVAVTGMGVATAVGTGKVAFEDALRAGTCGVSMAEDDGLGIAARRPAFRFQERVAAFELAKAHEARIAKVGRRAPIASQFSIATALEAALQAFGRSETIVPKAATLIIAGSNLSTAYQHRMYEKFARAAEHVPASYALHFLDTDQVGLVSEALGIQGEGFSVGAASASGNMAIIQGYRQIRYGISPCCIVVGAMTDLSPVELQGFRHAGALGGRGFETRPSEACRPFDADRNGFIYGQGAACLVLESVASARSRGAEILGHIAGAGTCLDANRSSDPSVAGEVLAMRRALKAAGIGPGDLDYVNAHGTSSVLGDATEASALRELLGAEMGKVAINSTKGMTGHCLHAASVVEAVATLIQMRGGFVHPNRNLNRSLDEGHGFAGSAAESRTLRWALSNGFGFGGINTSIVISEPSLQTRTPT